MPTVRFPSVGTADCASYDTCMMGQMKASQRNELRSLLKDLRSRLVSPRRQRAVSQEELAEWVGVSRNWYAALERGVPINPSISLLTRLAIALNATPGERAELFQLAIPALRGVL